MTHLDAQQGANRSVDIPRFIDEQPIGPAQIRLLLACASVLFLDGFDTQAIGFVAPEIVREWALPRGALGPVFSAGLFGLMIGALVFGPLADRIGRKKIIVASTIAFGLGTLATALARDTTALFALRLITGLGLGGAMPNAIALIAEYSPLRRRSTMVMTMFCGFSIGAALGGFIAAALIPKLGWQAVFVVGGVAPLFLAPLLLWKLPESVRFLALASGSHAAVAARLTAMFGTPFAAATRFVVPEAAISGVPIAHLFRDGRTTTTLLFWVVFFMSLLDLYFLSNWLPSVLNELGASLQVSVALSSLLQIGGVVGTFALGRFVDRFSYRTLAVTYLIASISIAAIGMSTHSGVLAAGAIFVSGFCVVGSQIACNALAANYYPTTLRSTGVGWALGVGRAGSIVGPLIGGLLLAAQWATPSLFMLAAVPALIASFAAVLLSRGSPGAARQTHAATLENAR